MRAYWITNELAVDVDREEKAISNGRSGDARVGLCRAPVIECRSIGAREQIGAWLYYLTTNGGAVALGPDSTDEHLAACARDLEITARSLAMMIADGGTRADAS